MGEGMPAALLAAASSSLIGAGSLSCWVLLGLAGARVGRKAGSADPVQPDNTRTREKSCGDQARRSASSMEGRSIDAAA